MKTSTIFALMLLAVVGVVSIDSARAAIYATEGAAYGACVAAQTAASTGNRTPVPGSCVNKQILNGYGNFYCAVWNAVNSYPCKSPDNNFQWRVADSCSTQPNSLMVSVPMGTLTCIGGCEYVAFDVANAPGDAGSSPTTPSGNTCGTNQSCPEGYYQKPAALGMMCVPTDGPCPTGQEKVNGVCKVKEQCPKGMFTNADGLCENKQNECPAGEIKSPEGSCLPGEGQCAAGEARKPDGTCGKDTDGDGKADEDDPENKTFSGGDNCNAPPSCSGDPILCGQARIQWRIECNTRKNRNISGGACGAVPVCTGENCDAMEYSQLLLQWRTACAVEKLNTGNGGTGSGQPDWTKVTGMSQDPGAGATNDDTKVLTERDISPNAIDQSGFSGGGQCIGLAQGGGQGVSSGFASSLASPPAYWCNHIGDLRTIAIMLAGITCCILLAKGIG